MRKAKRGGDHLTRSFCKSRRASKNKSLLSGRFLGDSDQGFRPELIDELISYWSKSVASIALYNGDTILFSCSGIAMERQGCHLTRFLTLASLVRALDGTNKDHDDLKVGSFQPELEIEEHHGETLVVLGRGVSGEIMAKNVELDGDLRVSVDDDDLDGKIEAWEGGPLLSIDRQVVGMNLFLTTSRAVFLPWGTILKHLEHYWTSQQKKTSLARSKTSKVYRFGARPIGEKSNSHPEGHGDFLNQEQLDLDSMGYPKLPSFMLGAGMILVNTFEETFGDIHGEGVWRKFSKRASNINRNVVALATFNANSQTHGMLNGQCREGTLQHYSLHYNVALVSVKDYPALHPSNILLRRGKTFKVAAVGRCFKSGALMATTGDLVFWTGTLDCNFLARSTCKITKAGIGGPLVNLDGDVIGMNFYDKRIGTPFLSLLDIYKILASFETKSKLGEVGNDSDPSGAPFWKMDKDNKTKLNRWPVPMPCWCNADYADEDKSDDDELGVDPKSGDRPRYGFVLGKKNMFF